MDVVYERCCGLDVHKRTVVACLLTPGPQGRSQKAVRTFGTMTADVLAMAEWLAAHEATHVAMESTGQYAEALHVFEEARRLGREYRLDTLLARHFHVGRLSSGNLQFCPCREPRPGGPRPGTLIEFPTAGGERGYRPAFDLCAAR
jgi:hypothetical protein